MSHLPPAYRGAPYHQPGPPSRRHRALRIFLLAVIAAAVLLLVIITGASIARGGVP
jgi:ferric-dicitrate binding protein FerR (iron transport regulator)